MPDIQQYAHLTVSVEDATVSKGGGEDGPFVRARPCGFRVEMWVESWEDDGVDDNEDIPPLPPSTNLLCYFYTEKLKDVMERGDKEIQKFLDVQDGTNRSCSWEFESYCFERGMPTL